MKIRFKSDELEYYYLTPLSEIKGKQTVTHDILKQYKRKIQILISIESINELSLFGSLHFESLKGARSGEYSIRLNLQYRLIFSITQDDQQIIEIILIHEISKHYEG